MPKPVVVSQRLVIDGGELKAPWVPSEILQLDGLSFLPLRLADGKLHGFIGVRSKRGHPLAANKFFHDLRVKRNDAVDALLLEHLNGKDAFGQLTELPAKARHEVDPADVARTVTVTLDDLAEDGTVTGQRNVLVAAEFNRKAVVSIHVTSENLALVCLSAKHAADTDELDQPHRPAVTHTEPIKGIFADKRRKLLWAPAVGCINGKKRVVIKPDVWDEFHINQAARELHDRMQQDIAEGPADAADEAAEPLEAEAGDEGAGAVEVEAGDEAPEAEEVEQRLMSENEEDDAETSQNDE